METTLITQETVDITPTPRILRILGDIPFDVWQCVAELTDNSIDAFKEAANVGKPIDEPRIDIQWSIEAVPPRDREILVADNGPGMALETLQNAAKAGYTSNDPIGNLGLFGMGFNISTAKLGDETVILSATKDSTEWVGIKINFDDLIRNQSFLAPVVRAPKVNSSEHGTKIIIKKLKDGVYQELKRKERTIRTRLETIYTTILDKKDIDIYMQGKILSPRPHCVWSATRFVMRKGAKVDAIQRIDRDLGETYFDIEKNRYLTDDEVAEYDINLSKGGVLPDNIVKRSRRLKGWIGIQRFSDPTEFGLDFVRNGRKILAADKSLFGYENQETGSIVTEYPVDLGSTVGGRIVGELNVDYLIPTYQKNGFETTSRAWRLTVEAIRGAGPILPQKRADMGYDGDNDSPLGCLVNAYRRTDPGTKHLSIPKPIAKEFLKEFRRGNLEFESDDKWYKAAQEADRERGEGGGNTTPVNTGDSPSDNPDLYGPEDSEDQPQQPVIAPITSGPNGATAPPLQTSSRDQLIQHAERMESLSGKFAYGSTPGMEVTTWKVKGEQIKIDGKRMPCRLFCDGPEVDFFYDSTHPILAEYPITPKQLLLQGLAERFYIREGGSIQDAFIGLVDNHLTEERINTTSLQERAQSVLGALKELLPDILGHRLSKVFEVIKAEPTEEAELAETLLDEAPQILETYQRQTEESIQALRYVSESTIVRLVENFPEEFFDGKFFDLPYSTITIGSEETQARLRKLSLEKITSYLKDLSVLLQGSKLDKHELIRYSNTLTILEKRIVS